MDYGKMAYLKAEELEARMLSPVSKQGARLLRASPFRPLGEELSLVTYDRGGFAVIAKLTVKSGGGTMYLTAGGMKAAECELSAGKSVTTLIAVAPGGKGEIRLNSKDLKDGVLECYELLFVGDVPEIKESVQGSNFAKNGEAYALLSVENDDLDLTLCDSRFVKSGSLAVGRGPDADVCGAKNGFYVVYGDVCGLLWGVYVDCGLNVISRSFLGEAVGKISAVCFDDAAYVFYVKDGAPYYFSTRLERGVRGKSFKVDFNYPVDSVAAVRGAQPFALAVESGGKVYLLKSEAEQEKRETLKVTVRGWTESV